MEEDQLSIDPFRDSIRGRKEISKWKKYSIISIIASALAMALLIVFIVLYCIKGEEKSKDEEEEEKWDDWKPAGNRIKTKWGINLDYKKVWQEYPRPQLQREDWINLNGPWKYAIRDANDIINDEFDGHILVPFPLESSLSGVMKNLSATEVIYYEKAIRIPESWNGKNVLLNFAKR